VTPPNRDYDQEANEKANTKSIRQLEEVVSVLTDEIKTLSLLLSKYIAAQDVRCHNNLLLVDKHEQILMGDGDARPGVGVRLSTLSLQVKLLMGILSVVSTTTLGITLNLLAKAIG